MGLEPAHRSDQFQGRAHGSLCVVFVGLWVAKVDQHATSPRYFTMNPPKRLTVSATHV